MTYMFTCTHFISSHFVPGSFRTQVISYPSHFAQCCSFHIVLIFSLLDVDTERNILTKFKKMPRGLGRDAITRKCLQIYGKTGRWKNGRRRDPSQESSSTSSANDQGVICEGIIHTLRIQLPGELCEDGSYMRT